ncbi:MAG: magnesium and cobalt transport protein CorA, partial [Bacteroidetes bacterium HGW-Bacteroidetes-22]
MNQNRKRYAQKTGMAPGTLVYTGGYTEQKTGLTRIDYHAGDVVVKKGATVEETFAPLTEGVNTWIHVTGLSDIALIEEVGARFGIHRLLLEDILNVNQQPKVVDQDNSLFVTLKQISFDQASNTLRLEHVCVIIGPGYIISFREKPGDWVDYISERLTSVPRLRTRGTDYLLYLLCDRIVDQYFLVLESFENELDAMEEALLRHPEKFRAERLVLLRKEFSGMRRQVAPLNEEFRKLVGGDISLIQESMRIYMHDVYDHLLQVTHTMENFRETYSSLLDFYVSQNDLRMNQIMKRLTVVATVFMPLGFIAAFYGMNFSHMPELKTAWGYPA